MYEVFSMRCSLSKFKGLYLSALGLVLPVVFQVSFVSLALYLYYTGMGRDHFGDRVGWVLLCLVALSSDILFYCIKRMKAEGYSSSYLSATALTSRSFRVLLFLVIYLVPLLYLVTVSSPAFIFWLLLLSGSARLAVYYVVREAEKSKIEVEVWSLLRKKDKESN